MQQNGDVQADEVESIYRWPEGDWWDVPAELSMEESRRIDTDIASVPTDSIHQLERMNPRQLMDAMREIMAGSEVADAISLTVARRLTEVTDRLERTRRYRERLVNHELMSDDVKERGGSQAERRAYAEICAEYCRCERAGRELMPLRDHEINLQHLRMVWTDIQRACTSLRKRLKQADQLGKVAQKLMANHGMKMLAETERDREDTVQRLLRAADEEDIKPTT